MEHTKRHPTPAHGYFRVCLTPIRGESLLRSNNERAFIVSQLQDLLSHRLLLDALPAYKQLASCIDLIAFSITRNSVNLVLFSIDMSITSYFMHCLSARLQQYRSDMSPSRQTQAPPTDDIHTSMTRLRGPHHALRHTIALHLLHPDWQYDRYSSIGFYLHDRRGDWMRTWRVSELYQQDPAQYRQLIRSERKQLAHHHPKHSATAPATSSRYLDDA